MKKKTLKLIVLLPSCCLSSDMMIQELHWRMQVRNVMEARLLTGILTLVRMLLACTFPLSS